MEASPVVNRDTLNIFYHIIVDYVKPMDVLPMLTEMLNGGAVVEIVAKEGSGGSKQAMTRLIQEILEHEDPGIFTLFEQALSQQGYTLILSHLRGYADIKEQRVYERMIKIMCSKLCASIIPEDLFLTLQERRCLSASDTEEIAAAQKMRGNRFASFLLLTRIGLKSQDWFPSFMWALRENGHAGIVKGIDEKIARAETYETMKDYCEMWKEQEVCIQGDEGEISAPITEAMTFSDGGGDEPSMAANPREDSRPDVKLPESDKKAGNMAAGRSDPDGKEGVDSSADADLRSLDFTSIVVPGSNQPPDVRPKTSPQRRRSLVDIASEDADDRSGATRDPAPLNLRSYQNELARDAMRGQNCIIVAPTGSGKTRVAIAIAMNHFEVRAAQNETAKAVFIVPTTALVEQQKGQFEDYMTQRVKGLSGDSQSGPAMTIENLMDQYDIFVLTPQILIDALRRDKGIRSIAEFSLIIFDECHHTMKDHPYNVIMNFYHEDKQEDDVILPQIIGLTASVGVGKARMQSQAEDHILKLAANLDCRITTVQENQAELERNVVNPLEDNVTVRGRVRDPFADKINTLMRNIETWMGRRTDAAEGQADMTGVREKINPPRARDEQQYTQWVATLEKEVARLRDQTLARFFYSCVRYLRTYHDALLINGDCRTKDAVTYITSELEKYRSRQRGGFNDETDDELFKMFTDEERQLELLADDPTFTNPKLEALKQVLLRKYDEIPDSRGILFCKTRSLTDALKNWIIEDAELKQLSPHCLTGSNAPAKSKGMTQTQQDNVLQYFRDGRHKLIIATTVAEEGLDISKCNLVIRYEHVTNETARIQAKGRARAEEGAYVLVSGRGNRVTEKENLNRIREKMMHDALREISYMDAQTFNRKIRDLQAELLHERQMKNAAKRMRKGFKQEMRHSFQLRCKKCNFLVCLAQDIRRIQNAHYVNVDQEFYRQATVILMNNFVDHGGEFIRAGKLVCKDCGEDWGMQAIYKGVPLPVIKISNFKIVNTATDSYDTYKKWKEVPFNDSVQQIEPRDLEDVQRSAELLMTNEVRIRLRQG